MRTPTSESRNARLGALLSSLDAAPDEGLTPAQRQHAATDLERIIAAPSTAGLPRTGRAASRRRSRRRLVLAVAVAVAVAGLAAVVVGGPVDGRAYASWTPDPAALTAVELNTVTPVCRDGLGKSDSLDMKRARLVLSERRGEIVALLYRTENPETAGMCLVHNLPGTDDVEDLNWGVGGGSGPALLAPPRGFTQGAMMTSRAVTITDGAVGDDVVAVTIHAPGDLTARATVQNGRYVVWWPGPAYDLAKEGTAEAQPIVTYDLTLSNGAVVRNAAPSR